MIANSIIPRSLRPGPQEESSVPGSYDEYESETPVNDDTAPGQCQSNFNGIERTTRGEPGSMDASLAQSRNHRGYGALKAKTDAYVDYTNKTLVPEQTDFMIQQLEKKPDPRLRRTYANGLALEEVIEWAPVLRVGLTFLPGADKPQVNRIEQINMEGKEPDQKDASWRLDTAGSLLTQFDVSPDLQIVQTDQTASIVARAKYQAKGLDRSFQDHKKALTRRNRSDDTVTIDSECVKIVNDFRIGDWDLRGLLVEVDWSSLWDLMVNYRNLISTGGPEMTFDETRTLLEVMIEDARRLCIRSPILFRMSTRTCIINSEHTRYGINHGPMFRTLTTSKGIKEIISLSAAYYNSLDPTGSDDSTQKYIRPRFLQMVVLLVSLLNNQDLAEIKDFLEATYKLKADRRDIELLILKVVPLMSINPRVFLKALVPAFDGFPLENGTTNKDEDHDRIWNRFITRILTHGYILPGTVDDLGRDRLSWIIKWPEDGFKSSTIFNNLQYAGRLRTINKIPPIEVHPRSDCTEVTVIMTDDSKYVINPRDLDNIIYMTPGNYPLQETAGSKRCYNLKIHETLLNGELYQAIKMTNEVVNRVNQWLASPKRGGNMVSKLVRKRTDNQPFLKDVRGTGRLVEVFAFLDKTTLAVTYKVEGRKISRIDAVQSIAREVRQLRAFIRHIEQRGDITEHSFFGPEKRELKQKLDEVKDQINRAEQSGTRIGEAGELSNEPVTKCLYPEGVYNGDSDVWNGYKAWSPDNSGTLHIEGKRSTVRQVRWLTGEVIELSLHEQTSKIFATPLQPVSEGYRNDEVQPGDVVMLIGQYVTVGKWDGDGSGGSSVFTMENCLRMVSMEEQSQGRRGRNRTHESDAHVVSCFK